VRAGAAAKFTKKAKFLKKLSLKNFPKILLLSLNFFTFIGPIFSNKYGVFSDNCFK